MCREDNLAIWIRVGGVQSFGTAVGGRERGSDGWLPRGRTGAIGLVGYLRDVCLSSSYHRPREWLWASPKSLKLCLGKWKEVIQGDGS